MPMAATTHFHMRSFQHNSAGAEQKTNVSLYLIHDDQERILERKGKSTIKTTPILQSVNIAFPFSKKPTFQSQTDGSVDIEF